MVERDIALATYLKTNFAKFSPLPSFPQSIFKMARLADKPTHEASGSHKQLGAKDLMEEFDEELRLEKVDKEDEAASTTSANIVDA